MENLGQVNRVLQQVLRFFKAYLVYALTSPELARSARAIANAVGLGSKHITFYHCMSDPHSFIALQALGVLIEKYNIKVLVIVVPEPADAGLPAYGTTRDQQLAWRVRDARILFNVYEDLIAGVPSMAGFPSAKCVHLAERWAVANLDNTFLETGRASQNLLRRVVQVSSLLLADDAEGLARFCRDEGLGALAEEAHAEALLAHNAQRLRRAGHYLSGMAYYGFEWFWGVDRLHYLEAILLSEERLWPTRRSSHRSSRSRSARPGSLSPANPSNALRLPSSMTVFSRTCSLLFRDKPRQAAPFRASADQRRELPFIDFFYSFRSPYSQVAVRTILEMADFYGLQVRFRPVLPMVMSGLPVPTVKALYIARDARREAERLAWTSYGYFNDPLGEGVRNALALYVEARAQGRERDFILAWSKLVWTRATDAFSHSGLQAICRATGIRWDPALLENNWWPIVKENRRALQAHGLWGVPSFAFMDTVVWGQDRLFVIEERIIRAIDAERQVLP